MGKLEAVILDLGNVLVLHDNDKLWRDLAHAFGTTPAAIDATLTAPLLESVGRGLLSGDELRGLLGVRLGREIAPVEWLSVWNGHFTVNEPMVRLVERLLGRVRLVLLSNTNAQHFDYMRPRVPVLERFDGLVLSYELGHVKPERPIYERALAVAAVEPERAAFFDDVEEYARGATQVGVKGVVFHDAKHFGAQLEALGLVL